MMRCNGCDLPAHRTAITTMTSFRHDGVLLHFGEKGTLVLHRYDDDDGLQIMFMMKEIFKYVPDEVDDAIFHPS